MSYVTVAWSILASCALLLALMYGCVWLLDRRSHASLAFSVLGLSVVGMVVLELAMMRAGSVREWTELVRWLHLPVFSLIVAIVVFTRLYLGAGRAWLMWTIIAMRAVVVVIDLVAPLNFNYVRVDSLERVMFLGEPVSVVGQGVISPWQWAGTLSTLLLLGYLADAARSLWRSGSPDARRRAVVIGSATFMSAALAILYAQLMLWTGAKIPALLTPPFLLLFGAMAFEMSRDTLRSTRLARELRSSEERLEFAASAAGIGLWSWDSREDRIWATQAAHLMCGTPEAIPLDLARMRASIHAEDIPRIEAALRSAAVAGVEWQVEFRVLLPGGGQRWLQARGRSEADDLGNVTLMRGVLRDINDQRLARQEVEELRRDLAHAGRVAALGTLTSSITHELGQPLGAILNNAEAGEILLRRTDPDLEEILQIMVDVQRDGRRAGEVINSMRSLLRRRELAFEKVSLSGLLQDVATLLRADAASRNVVLDCGCDPDVPEIRGDRVHLTQVLINVAINAMDAVAQMPESRRRVVLRAWVALPGWVEIVAEDRGPGIPESIIKDIFEPFYTTKASGTGLGLSVSRTIIDAHQGQLSAENRPEGGALFRIRLPAQD